jgi:hypothetical protein
MYSLKYSSEASPDVVLIMGEELFAQPTILVVKNWSPFIPRYVQYVESVLRRKKLIPYKPYVCKNHVESILGTFLTHENKKIQFEYYNLWQCMFSWPPSFPMYSLKYSSAASPDVVLVMGEELFAQPIILVVIMLFSQ